MKKILCQLALVVAVANLAGCGLKGPLYFPKNESTTKTAPSTQSDSNVQNPATSGGQVVQPVQ